jgi:acetyltransferase-like isoleucine patch superfamily enzyme
VNAHDRDTAWGRWTDRVRRSIDSAITRRQLASCTRVGERATLRGTPFVRNLGELTIGDDFWLNSAPVQSHIVVTGKMHIGARVRIGSGAAISCQGGIVLEDDVSIGDFAMILDSDFHVADDVTVMPAPKPIRIGNGVRLGHRVVVLPGTTIGAGVTVKAGSVVSGDVPENTVIEGNPARARLVLDERAETSGDVARDVPILVMHVLGLSSIPELHAGPAQIESWDSLGALRLIVALEETFGIALAEDQMREARSVRDLVGHVEAAQRRKSGDETAAR